MKLWLGIIFFFVLHSIYADVSFRFERYSVDQGLSENTVRCLFQDNVGFLWIGTKDGLNKFDGNTFKIYKKNPDNRNSLLNNTINVIQEFDKNTLIICTSGGINFLDLSKDSFSFDGYFKGKIILSIHKDTNNWYIVGTFDGLYLANFKLKKYIDILNNPSYNRLSIMGNSFMCFVKDTLNRLWTGTEMGLNIIDFKNNKSWFFNVRNRPSLLASYITDLKKDNYGNIWIGSSGGGVSFCSIEHILNHQFIIETIVKGSVMDILLDRKGNVWVGNGASRGLYLIHKDNILVDRRITILKNQPTNWQTLADNSIECLLEDATGNIWIGTHSKGVNMYSPKFKKFHSYINPEYSGSLSNGIVRSFIEDELYFWIGTENGLNRIHKKSGKLKIFKYEESEIGSIGGNAIFCLFIDSKKRLWVGTWAGGLNLYNYQTETFTTFLNKDDDKYSLPSNHVFAINEDTLNRIWVGTVRGGLSVYDEKNNRFINFFPDSKNPNTLFSNSINSIVRTIEGNFWISTYFSADYFNPYTLTFEHYTTFKDEGSDLLTIYIDSKNNVWFGSESGLAVKNRYSKDIKKYDVHKWMPSYVIKAICEDDKGNLWLSTNNGLCKFENAIELPNEPVIKLFFKNDGLQGNAFNPRSAYKDKKGIIYFGGINGYTFFQPDSIVDNTLPPKIVITNIINYKTEISLKKGYITEGEVIKLNYNSSGVIIHFAALNYVSPSFNKYKYRLIDIDEEWHYTQIPKVLYPKIIPGNYVFEVYGANNDGIWSDKPATIKLIISPPWWQTFWFYLVLIFLFLLITYTVYYLRILHLRKKKQELENLVEQRTEELMLAYKQLEESQEEIIAQNNELEMHRNHLEQIVDIRTRELQQALKKAEESDKLKSAFLANMSHEIRTPMNAIIGFSNLIVEEKIPVEKRKDYVEIIQKNCDTLNYLINDILDLSMIESDQLKLYYSKVNINDLLSDLEKQFKLYNLHIEIKITRMHDRDVFMYTDYMRLKQIITNLIANAIKFTNEGYVHFGYYFENDRLVFFVEDTGIGIDKEFSDKLFKPFTKIEPKDKNILFRGTGLGLSICKKLTELLGGEIKFNSVVDKGTTFYISFPYQTQPHVQELPHITKQNKEYVDIHLNDFTFLIAEDEADNFSYINEILISTGAKVLWAKNGVEVLSIFHSLNYTQNCIILMDIKMPEMTGIEVIDIIRNEGYKNIAIALTAYAHTSEKEKIMQHGFDGYLAKPITKQTLFDEIMSQIKKNTLRSS